MVVAVPEGVLNRAKPIGLNVLGSYAIGIAAKALAGSGKLEINDAYEIPGLNWLMRLELNTWVQPAAADRSGAGVSTLKTELTRSTVVLLPSFN